MTAPPASRQNVAVSSSRCSRGCCAGGATATDHPARPSPRAAHNPARMFDHVALRVSDFAAAAAAYRRAARDPRRRADLARTTSSSSGRTSTSAPPTPRTRSRPGVHVGLVAPIARDGRRVLARRPRGRLRRRRRARARARVYGARLLRRLPARRRRQLDRGLPARQRRGRRASSTTSGCASPTSPPRAPSTRRVAPFTGFELVVDEPRPARFRGPSASFTVLAGRAGPQRACTSPSPRDDDAVGARSSTPPRWRPAPATTARPASGPEYHPGYYGAFVLDPDGHNVEVVNHNR